MAYSKDPFNYPPLMHRLVESFADEEDEIPLQFPSHRSAYKFQMQFYAFIRSLVSAGDRAFKMKDKDNMARWKRVEVLARTRKVTLTASPDLTTGWTLSFIRRDADPDINFINQQLDERAKHKDKANEDITILSQFTETKIPASLHDFFHPSDGPDYKIDSPPPNKTDDK